MDDANVLSTPRSGPFFFPVIDDTSSPSYVMYHDSSNPDIPTITAPQDTESLYKSMQVGVQILGLFGAGSASTLNRVNRYADIEHCTLNHAVERCGNVLTTAGTSFVKLADSPSTSEVSASLDAAVTFSDIETTINMRTFISMETKLFPKTFLAQLTHILGDDDFSLNIQIVEMLLLDGNNPLHNIETTEKIGAEFAITEVQLTLMKLLITYVAKAHVDDPNSALVETSYTALQRVMSGRMEVVDVVATQQIDNLLVEIAAGVAVIRAECGEVEDSNCTLPQDKLDALRHYEETLENLNFDAVDIDVLHPQNAQPTPPPSFLDSDGAGLAATDAKMTLDAMRTSSFGAGVH